MLITNNFIKNNSTTFKGKFSLIDAKCDISGVRYFNKKVVVTKDYFYHPSADETQEQIDEKITKNTKGFRFSLIEKDHFHQDGQYYIVQRIFPSEITDKQLDKKSGALYAEKELISENALYDTFSNYAYGVMDLRELDKFFVQKLKTVDIKEIKNLIDDYQNGK